MARILAVLLTRLLPSSGRHRLAAAPHPSPLRPPAPLPRRRVVCTGRAVFCDLFEVEELPLVRPFLVQWEQAERRSAESVPDGVDRGRHGRRVAV